MLSDESYGGKKQGKRMGRPRELGGGVRARREKKIPNRVARGARLGNCRGESHPGSFSGWCGQGGRLRMGEAFQAGAQRGLDDPRR